MVLESVSKITFLNENFCFFFTNDKIRIICLGTDSRTVKVTEKLKKKPFYVHINISVLYLLNNLLTCTLL